MWRFLTIILTTAIVLGTSSLFNWLRNDKQLHLTMTPSTKTRIPFKVISVHPFSNGILHALKNGGYSKFASLIPINSSNSLEFSENFLSSLVNEIVQNPRSFNQWLNKTASTFPHFDNCSLTKDDRVYDITKHEFGYYVRDLFNQIEQFTNGTVQISRFNLFHGHLVSTKDSIGIVFHAMEYPAFDEVKFPINLGYCQRNSDLKYEPSLMVKRNFLWMADTEGEARMFDINVVEAKRRHLIPHLDEVVYTLDEDILGIVIADVYFLPQFDRTYWSSYLT